MRRWSQSSAPRLGWRMEPMEIRRTGGGGARTIPGCPSQPSSEIQPKDAILICVPRRNCILRIRQSYRRWKTYLFHFSFSSYITPLRVIQKFTSTIIWNHIWNFIKFLTAVLEELSVMFTFVCVSRSLNLSFKGSPFRG